MIVQTRFFQLLEKKIEETTQTQTDGLLNGNVSDYPEYREKVGYLRGLQDALKLADETNTEMNQ